MSRKPYLLTRDKPGMVYFCNELTQYSAKLAIFLHVLFFSTSGFEHKQSETNLLTS